MNSKRKLVATSITAALGTSATMVSKTAVAGLIAAGSYVMTINNTPKVSGSYNFGTNGNWNSGFTLGCLPGAKGCTSAALYDDISPEPVLGVYNGVINDGVAGFVGIKVDAAGNINGPSENSDVSGGQFSMDTINGSAFGNFVQYGVNGGQHSFSAENAAAAGAGNPIIPHPTLDASYEWTGFVDSAGNMTLTPDGRLGRLEPFPILVDSRWNIDDFNGGTGTGTNFVPNPPTNNTTWQQFTSGSVCASLGCIDGTKVVNVGDVNNDGIDDYTVVLVSAGKIGSDYGGFFGSDYYEVWASTSTILSVTSSPVPAPAALWLFGSGLAGLMGVAKKRKKSGKLYRPE